MDQFSADEARILALLASIPRDSLELRSGLGQYYQPLTLQEGLVLRGRYPETVIVNGASDVALRVTKKHESLPAVLDLSAIDALRVITDRNGVLTVGAGVTMNALLSVVRDTHQAIHSMLEVFGAQQIRNVATVGGNLGTASPVGDLLPLLIAYGASVRLESVRGSRDIPAAEFVCGYRKTVCAPDELITAVAIPHLDRKAQVRAYKISRRRDLDIASVSGGFRIELDQGGCVENVTLAYGGMADRTKRAGQTETFLTGKPWNRRTVEQAMAVLEGDFAPIDDVRGSGLMRRVAARNLLLKFWTETNGMDRQEEGWNNS
jgi:xanthine dehydrogenase small subunit